MRNSNILSSSKCDRQVKSLCPYFFKDVSCNGNLQVVVFKVIPPVRE